MSEQLVVNELLSFLQQKLDVMDEVSAVQICATNFSEEDIAAAKLLLYTALNKREQMVSRRRDGTKRSLQDIITLFKETDPDDVPTFVAKELNKLPPVTFDHVDVTSLLKDIVSLKASLADVLAKLDASQNIVTDLRKEVGELRNSVAVSRSAVNVPSVDTCRGAGHDISSSNSASAVSTPAHKQIAELAEHTARAPRVPAATPSHCAARTVPHDPLRVSAAPANSQRLPRDFASIVADKTAPARKPVPEKAPIQADDGFVTVVRKRRQRTIKNRCGTAPSEPNVTIRAAKPNTPVYISRLHYTTTAGDIVEYVRQKTKYVARVQLLESRRNVNFKAFVVRIPTCFLHLVLEEDFWPQGVVFRRFRGQVPQERAVT